MYKILIFCAIFCIAGAEHDKFDWEMHDLSPENTLESRFRMPDLYNEEETTATFWENQAQAKLLEKLKLRPNLKRAKNVIFFIGDGMSIPTITAARIHKGQLEGNRGEDEELFMEKLPYSGLSKTFCVNAQVADSACSATAYHCGVKTNILTIGVTANVQVYDCAGSENPANHLESLVAKAQRAGKSTGIVTTTTVSNASPAGAYAHTAFRMFESDADIAEYMKKNINGKQCQDIVSQLVLKNPGRNMNVILGGGRAKFLPNTTLDEDGRFGERLDRKNLIKKWKKSRNGPAEYVWNRDGLLNVRDDTDYLLGLFSQQHMNFRLDADHKKEPSLTEMTEAAIKVLKKNKKGYFLFVEGGRIDHGHHYAKAQKAIVETIEFDKAIKRATELTSDQDTLIVVSADHAHTLTIAGYSNRGNPILGLGTYKNTFDTFPYTTLTYANGPGYQNEVNGKRPDPSENEFLSYKEFQYPGSVPIRMETHGGDDVAILASGPWSHLFTGIIQQNVIPHIISFASCLGEGLTACKRN